MTIPQRVKIVEVGPRDGLQNETALVPSDIKIQLVEKLAATGLSAIECGSFVNPKWVPQMADSAAVFSGIQRQPGVTYSALTPNLKGLESAIAAGVDEVAVFGSCTEAFSLKNINCSIEESLARFKPLMRAAEQANLKVRAYLSCAFGCPYSGEVSPLQVAKVARQLEDLGCYEIAISDTIGTGTPALVESVVNAVAGSLPLQQLAMHFHDTQGRALANVEQSLKMGITVFDSAIGGLGGCPYADGASGNLATEALVGLLHNKGVETGVDLAQCWVVGEFINAYVGAPKSTKPALASSKNN
ncbi:hydroxymethylglutaryl-CoA lyase [Halioxenophilus aromaticivorans]|uniref:Hydroxymethylglutaryl-CoA lyase n=1 Tax=Halioxenophilus aromaticivorans TaxID=1306992 RepID=A0AAV3U3B2_9ALTE